MRKEQENKGRKKSNKNKSKATNKMAIRTYISIITLNVNGLNAPTKDIDWLNGCKNKTHIYMLSSRDPLHFQGHIQTESKRMEENIPCKWESKLEYQYLYQKKYTLK